MAVPDFQSFFVPLLNAMAAGGEYALVDVRKQVQAELHLSDADALEKLPSGTQTKFANRLAWAAGSVATDGKRVAFTGLFPWRASVAVTRSFWAADERR
jgi:restriction system protein